MRGYTDGRYRSQISFLRRQFFQEGGLPFSDVLSNELVSKALATSGVAWKDRVYTPLVTLWVFLGQVDQPPARATDLPCLVLRRV